MSNLEIIFGYDKFWSKEPLIMYTNIDKAGWFRDNEGLIEWRENHKIHHKNPIIFQGVRPLTEKELIVELL